MRTLYLIDGYAQFFRAYHAIRTPMSSPVTGEPTNMTFGFIGMLLKLLRGEGKMDGPPDAVAVALDVSGDRGTFRSELYEDYKATRPEPPSDLRVQVDRCLAALREVGVPVVGAEGFEADDVIATIASRLIEEDPDLRIRIISKDKDLKQILVPGRVELFDIHKDELFTAETLKEETGLEPRQVIDMLALMGDTVDNVPGVEGVGEKTAAKMIGEYGSLEALLSRADEVKGKRGEKLREAAGRLGLSRELVTLRHDAPIEFELEEAARDRVHLERLTPILRELGFNRYQEEVERLVGSGDAKSRVEDAASGPKRTGSRSKGPAFGGLFDAVETPIEVGDADYRTVCTKRELGALVDELRGAALFAVDTETTSLAPMRAELCGLSFSTTPGTGCYVPVRSPTPERHLDEATVLGALRPLLEDPARPKCGHNLKYDLLILRRAGVELRGLEHEGSCDSMVASYLIDASRSSHSMDALALALLDHTTIPIRDLIGSGKEQRRFDEVPLERAGPYAAEDADISLRLARLMMPQLRAMGLARLWHDVEMPLVEVLAELEWNGILVDPEELSRQEASLQEQIRVLRESIRSAAVQAVGRAFDPDSPRQLSAVLFNKADAEEPGLGLTVIKRGKTGPSTDAEVLEKLAQDATIESDLPRLILDYRQLTKLVNTYLVNLRECIDPETRRIHASFNQTGAATGRLSSSDPNLQNIPIRTEVGREIRRAFIAPPGRVLITADYSQIELRLLAHLSRDPALIEAFEQGEDIHTAVAAQIHGVPVADVTREQRSGAKMVNFGIVYGITAFGLARRLDIGRDEAARIIDDYKRRFRGITTFLQECIEQARRYGYVETMLGRRRPIQDIDSNQPQRRAFAERIAINSVVQGSAADLIKIAMVRIMKMQRGAECEERPDEASRALRDVKMLLQIHDELVFEAPEGRAESARIVIVKEMEGAMALRVPLVVDSHVAGNWYEGK
ncbi:MAG: DNA polymerase I [Phycisphaeraceae bacterium]|nr:DNA polymerase I [Phycisphaeraceae bacterium]